MKWRVLAELLGAAHLVPAVYSAGTTVWVSISYCPATATGLATGPGIPGGTPTPLPQYFLSVSPGSSPAIPKERRDAGPSYISPRGSVTGDCNNAATYTLTESGQLISGGKLVSTTGLLPYAPFAPSSNIAAISTKFSASTGILHWNNTAFVGNQALFCQTGTTIEAVFSGQLPTGCSQVTLDLLLVSPTSCPIYRDWTPATGNLATSASTGTISVTVATASSSSPPSLTTGYSYPNSLSSNTVVANLIGGYVYASTFTVLSGVNKNIMSLEQCLTFCTGYLYFGVSGGNLCICGNVIAVGSTPAYYGSCITPCAGDAEELCGGPTCIAVFGYRGLGSAPTSSTSVSTTLTTTLDIGSALSTPGTSTSTISSTTATASYPTSTGTPNCLDRSPFTGTINGGYLILCDTALPGYELAQVNGASLADCITACNHYVASFSPQQQHCVAVEYDQNAAPTACHLKYTIGAISNGQNATAQAAVLVNQPNSPPIIYSTIGSFTSSTSLTTSVDSEPTMMTTTASTTQTAVPTTNRNPVVHSSPSMMAPISTSSTSAIQAPPSGSISPSLNLISAPSSASSTVIVLPPPESSSSATGILPTLTTTSIFSPASNLPWPSASSTVLCPGSNHKIISQGLASYEVECSEQLLGDVLTGNSTTASSLQQCFDFCNLLNLAQPFGCVGVNYLKTLPNFNCLLLSTVTGYLSSAVEDSGRLIYAGYSSVTDTPLVISSTTISLSSAPGSSTLSPVPVGGTSSPNRPSSSIVGSNATTLPVSATTSSTTFSASIIISSTTSPTITMSSSPSFISSSIDQSSLAVSSTLTLSSSSTKTVSPLSSADVGGTCGTTTSTSIAPIPTSALCPGTPDGTVYGVSFSGSGTGSGTPYEIECSTSFAGVINQPVVALSLQDCINTCQQYKYQRQLPCYAVSFNNSAAALTLPPQNNCNLYNSVTSVTHGISQFDSARIVSNSSGYPIVNDYCSLGGAATASTAPIPLGAQSSSLLGIGFPSSNVANVPVTTITTTGSTGQPAAPGAGLCPGSNTTFVQDGNYKYEVECGLYYGGHDIGKPPGYSASPTNLDGCVLQCNFWNDNPSLGHTCIYALYAGPPLNSCYNKDSVTGPRAQMVGYNIARLISSAYPTPTDLS